MNVRCFVLGAGISLISIGAIHPLEGFLVLVDFFSVIFGGYLVGYAIYGKWDNGG